MKNSKIFTNMLAFATSALLLVGCNNNVTEVIPIENKDFSVINGATIKTEIFSEFQQIKAQDPIAKNYAIFGDTVVIYHDPTINKVSGTTPDLKNLKSTNDSKPLRYVAVGSSLTAGMRDGGYFNEGIMTSYPNLIARQMQLTQFNQPYFDDNSYNGFGRKAPTGNNPTGGPIQKFNVVKNNLGVESISSTDITLKKYKGAEIDNFAVPYLGREVFGKYGTSLKNYQIGTGLGKSAKLKKEMVTRIFAQDKTFDEQLFLKSFDFITIEFRTTEILNILLGGNNNIGQIAEERYIFEAKPYEQINLGLTSELSLLRELEEKNIKNGILLNVPNYISFPYFNSVSNEMIKTAGLDKPLSISISLDGTNTSKGYFDIETGKLLPTSTVDSLLSLKVSSILKYGINNNPPLKIFTDAISKSAYSQTVNNINSEISLFSRKFDFPIVDIKSLYDNVINNSYISNDGLKITSKEFFSTDGIYPSALGQACIANEIIKVINNSYKTAIPLINIKEFVK